MNCFDGDRKDTLKSRTVVLSSVKPVPPMLLINGVILAVWVYSQEIAFAS
eukprot:m.469648 g.469648  ORF g.469648 m.469648 type:complete len:50 (-) comp28899_c0_seq1:118-267(-)